MAFVVNNTDMKYRQKSSIITVFTGGLMLFALLVVNGCSRPAGIIFTPLEEPLIWPQPPETPRIAYMGTISTEEDLKPGISWTQGFTELLFGKEDIGVLVSPSAVVYDDERMYVADSSAGVVHVFDMQTRQYQQLTSLGGGEKFMMPVAITLVDQNICIADSVLKKVCVFDRDGEFKFAFGQDVLLRPTGIAFGGAQGKLYVTDTARHRINVFDKEGRPLFEFGSRGIDPGQFNFPTHLWADREGKVYVSDTLNYRVQVFSGDGTFVRMFGVHGDRPGNFAHPAGIAADSEGHIYVVDKQYENVQIFDQEGNILMAFGAEGNDPGDFWLPAGIFICSDDRIYVADSFNKRIQIFDYLKAGDDED